MKNRLYLWGYFNKRLVQPKAGVPIVSGRTDEFDDFVTSQMLLFALAFGTVFVQFRRSNTLARIN